MPSNFHLFRGNTTPPRAGVKAVTVTGPSGALEVGQAYPLTATPTWFGRGTRIADKPVTWSLTVGSGTVASIDAASGVVTGVGAGSWTARAVIEGVGGDFSGTVNAAAAEPTTMLIFPTSAVPTLATVGATYQLSASVRDQFNVAMTGRTINWATTNAAIATVDANGLVTAVATGTCNITATDSVVGACTASKSVTVNTALVPSYVTVTPDPLEIAVGSTRQLSAKTYTSSNVEITGRTYTYAESDPDFSVNATGLVTAVNAGTGTITVTDTTDASPQPSKVLNVTITTPAAGAGQLESPTGRRPQYCWSLEQQYIWNQWHTDYLANPTSSDPHIQIYAEMVRDASQTNWEFSAVLFQITGLQSWADLAIPGYIAAVNSAFFDNMANTTEAGVDSDAMREYLFSNTVYYDWLYAGMNATQKVNAWQALDNWTASALGEVLDGTTQSGGANDDDQAAGLYVGLAAVHFLNVPENVTRYRNVLNQSRRYTDNGAVIPLGGEAAALTTVTGESHANHREFINEIFGRASAGGHSHEGVQYAAGTFHLQIIGCLGLRQASTNANGRQEVDVSNFLPEFTATFEEAVERMHSIIYPGESTITFWGDMEVGRGALKHYRLAQCMAALTGLAWQLGTAGAARAQRAFNDYVAARVANIRGQAFIDRMFWFWNPYASATVGALAEESAPVSYYIGRDAAPSLQYWGPGHKYIKYSGATSPYHVALFGANEHLTDHAWAQWGDFEIWRNGEILIRHPIAYSNPLLLRPGSHNVMALAGLPAMQKNITSLPWSEGWGVVSETDGTAGGIPYSTLAAETHGAYYDGAGNEVPSQAYYNPPGVFVTEARRMFAWLHRVGTDVDCLVYQSKATTGDLLGNQAMTSPGFGRHTDNISVTNALAGTYYNAHVLKTLGIGLVWSLSGKTINAGKWGTAMLSIAADGTTTQTTWAATVNLDTQALAEAEMPAVPANHTALGWVSIKAGSGAAWVGGTSALQSGGGTSPASITSYKAGTTIWVGNPYLFSRYTAADQARILAAKTLTGSGGLPNGSEKLLHLHIPTTATLTAGPPAYHGWQTAGGQDVRVYHLAPTASTTPAGTLSHSTATAASISPEAGATETTGLNVLRSWNTTRQDTDKFTQVIMVGVAANFPAVALSANNPDIVLIGTGGTQRTINFSTGVAVVT
jgi:uncharacterized protein YjdB